jgi:putative flippase GtrA
MIDEPDKPGWKPTVSTVAGGGFGLAVSQVTLYAFWAISKVDVPPEISCAWGTICTSVVSYFFPDGGRK